MGRIVGPSCWRPTTDSRTREKPVEGAVRWASLGLTAVLGVGKFFHHVCRFAKR